MLRTVLCGGFRKGLRNGLRSGAIATAAMLALAMAHPAAAAGGRAEARTAGKAPHAAAASRPAAMRPAVTASRRPVVIVPGSRATRTASGPHLAVSPRAGLRTASRGAERPVLAGRGGPVQVRAAGRREVSRREIYRAADRRPILAFAGRSSILHGRPGLRMVGLFSSPAAAATLPARGWKAGKPAFARIRPEGGEGRTGTWHAGLPAADGEQMDCPAGTMAVLARGHADTFRCMPL